jgi:hypothetical protein
MKQTLIIAATETCMGIPQVNPDLLIKQVVGECVLAILATDTRDIVYTTFDRGLVEGTIQRVVDQVKNHFKDN